MPKTISVIGAGYVGLITGIGFAELGCNVICMDINRKVVDTINSGRSHIYEKGVDEILEKVVGRNLKATTDMEEAVLNSDVTFICVGTPSKDNGNINLDHVKEVSKNIGGILEEKMYHTIVTKSTVTPGTTGKVIIPLLEKSSNKKAGVDFGVAVNPEFLKEGVAIEDFMDPDRIVIGSYDERSGDIVECLYSDFSCPVLRTDLRTAEMIKYTSNAFLATKISFINEVGNICRELGINSYDVAEGIGLDQRISPHFLKAGLGFGGSCLPKDTKELVFKARSLGYEPDLLASVLRVNEGQPERLLNIARERIGGFNGKKVAVLGLAFKGDTDDTRDSQAFPVIKRLLKENANITVYDPKAEENTKIVFEDRIQYADFAEDALGDSDIALVLTDWREFENLDFSGMRRKIVVDARNIVKNRENMEYEGLCW